MLFLRLRLLSALFLAATVAAVAVPNDKNAAAAAPEVDDIMPTCQKSQYVDSGPFCAPKNESKWYSNGHYYVTWDSGMWMANSTVYITLNYHKPGNLGRLAKDWEKPNSAGFIQVTPDKEWLLNRTAEADGIPGIYMDEQPMYFLIRSDSVNQAGARNWHQGATVIVSAASKPREINKSQRNPISWLGLAIGLPTVFAFIFLMICGTHFCMRNQRKIGPIAIGGGRRHFKRGGYSGRKARAQRAMQGGLQAEYTDDPVEAEYREQQQRDWELANVRGGR